MKLIFIYGPPATGKLTIANEIKRKTNYRIFHNHMIIDLCDAILDSKSKRYWNFARKLRIDLIKEAIKQKIPGLIMTMAYTGEGGFIRQVIRMIEKEKSKVYLVRLTSSTKDLEKRVYAKSREKFGKLKTKAALKRWFGKYGETIFSGRKSLILNTSKLSAKQCADKIIRFCGRG